MIETHKMPEDTVEQLRDKYNSYLGDIGEKRLKVRELEMNIHFIQRDIAEVKLIACKLAMKLRDTIAKKP